MYVVQTPTPLFQIITPWVHAAFAPLRKTVRSNLARQTSLPTQAQSRLNRLWCFPKDHPLPTLVDWTDGENQKHQALVAALPLHGRTLQLAFELHPSSPWPSQNRVEEAFFYRLGRKVQALGYTPLFVLDRGFDRVPLMRRLKTWGMGFLIRLRGHRRIQTQAGEGFCLQERYPQVIRPQREGVEVELLLAQGPPHCREQAVEELRKLLQELEGEK
ncbi:hypothetical protein SY28_14225 [Meiothermus taiwanensis]|nr:hypothetical protein SY28_14225 [Meiothermus taiwanensis]KZK17014.1 hypothetical protein A3962_13480 [Meiothermus taiwanensis]